MSDLKQFVTSFATLWKFSTSLSEHLQQHEIFDVHPRARRKPRCRDHALHWFSSRRQAADYARRHLEPKPLKTCPSRALKAILKGKGFMISLRPVMGPCLISESPGLANNSCWCSIRQGLDHLNLASWSPKWFIIMDNHGHWNWLYAVHDAILTFLLEGKLVSDIGILFFDRWNDPKSYVSRCQQVQLRLERTWQVCFRKPIPGWARKLSPRALQKNLVW